LGDAAYERLKQAIIECEILPGEEVSLPVIVDRYSLTDAQARHALVRLAQEGWVSAMPRRGYTVMPLTMQDVEDIFQLRMMLEPAAMREAAGRIGDETLKRLEAANKATYVAGDPASIRYFLRENRAYYITIVSAIGNKILTRIIDRLFDSVTRLLYFSSIYTYESDLIRQHHQQLLEALMQGDGEAAERLRYSGLEYARESVRKALSSSPSLMAVNLAPPRLSTHRVAERVSVRSAR
jgi:DNA-binding GntR family transcriptional regulator